MNSFVPGADSIVAIATAPGRSGIGVLRVSGRDIDALVDAVVGKPLAPRVATLAAFLDARGMGIDTGIALLFRAPRSYTGEDVLELHGHGGPVVLNLLLKRCLELGCRLAQPGEFTRRAYLNDKIDLAQAEGVADLIDAASAQAARAAMRSLDGGFSREVHALRERLIELRALVEATLDFPEEEIDLLTRADAWGRLQAIKQALDAIQLRATQGARLRAGFNVVLAGRPNVGKSSLLNALSGEEAAIVTAIPGTTRDRIEKSITIDGMPVNIVDTAGLHETSDEVEILGIAGTRKAIGAADMVLHLVDATAGVTLDDLEIARSLPATIPVLTIHNKIDAAGAEPLTQGNAIHLSAKTGAGLELLRSALRSAAGLDGAGEDVILARERHLQALRGAAGHVALAVPYLDEYTPALELLAEELRLAQEALGTITGEFTADDLLGEIFGRFCIGK